MALDELERILRSRDDVAIGHGVTDETVQTAEEALQLTFPPDLKDFLKRFGHIEVGHFELLGLGDEIPEYLDIVRVTQSERTESGCPLPANLVPLLNDGGGNLYCVAVHDEQAAPIVFWDHEAGPEQEPDLHASSLEAWILSLLGELDEV
jgi:cell wall assembly regulator SMI1